MARLWIAPWLAALAAGLPAPSGDDALPEGALARLGSWRLRHRDPVTAVDVGPSGVLSTGMDGRAALWSPAGGARLGEAAVAASVLVGGAFLPQGGAVLLRSDGALLVWDPDADAPGPPRGEGLGTRLALAPSGAEACVTGPDGVARLVALETGAVRAEIELGDRVGAGAAYSPAGDLLAVLAQNRNKLLGRGGTRDQPSAEILLVEPGEPRVLRRIESRERNLLAVAVTPDGERVVATDDRGAVGIWRVADGALERTVEARSPSPARGLALLADGELAAVGRDDGALELIRLAGPAGDGSAAASGPGERVAERALAAPVAALAASGDGALLAVACGFEVLLFDLPDLAPRAASERHRAPVSALAWSGDGARVATGSYDHDVRVWDAETGSAVWRRPAGPGFVYALAFGAERLLAGGQDGRARALDPADGEPGPELPLHDGACTDLALSPDGTRLATAGADRRLLILDAESGAPLHALADLPGVQFHVAWSPDGDRVAVGASDVRIVDAASGEVVTAFARLPAPLAALAWSPDGATIAAGLADRTIALLDVAGAPRRFLHGHAGRLTAVAWSPDGRLFASASANESGARLWSWPEGEPAGRLEGFEREVLALAFDPEGRRLAAGSMDGTGLIWSVEDR